MYLQIAIACCLQNACFFHANCRLPVSFMYLSISQWLAYAKFLYTHVISTYSITEIVLKGKMLQMFTDHSGKLAPAPHIHVKPCILPQCMGGSKLKVH